MIESVYGPVNYGPHVQLWVHLLPPEPVSEQYRRLYRTATIFRPKGQFITRPPFWVIGPELFEGFSCGIFLDEICLNRPCPWQPTPAFPERHRSKRGLIDALLNRTLLRSQSQKNCETLSSPSSPVVAH